jgi:uncharacterized protein YjiS (DUF1127 family)
MHERHHVSNKRQPETKETFAMKMHSFAQARALSREFFPTWSRRARARWVLARLQAQQPRVPISSGWSHDLRAYWYQRTSRA